MRLSATLTGYIGRQFTFSLLGAMGLLLLIVYLFDTLELLRRAAKRDSVPLDVVIEMSVLKLPQVGQELIAFAILFAAMFTFWRLTRTHELVVVRAAGVSIWQFLMPVLLVALTMGALKLAVINPVGSALLTRYEALDNRWLRGRASSVDLSETGLWLRQIGPDDSQTVIHAGSVLSEDWALKDVLVLFFDAEDRYVGRIDGASAQLDGGAFRIGAAWLNQPGSRTRFIEEYSLPTDITVEQIEDSFAPPQTLSFWYIPQFIETLDATGFPSTRLRLHYQSLIAEPLLFIGLVLLAACVALRPPRRGHTLMLLGSGVMVGFALFFVSDVVEALGLSETIPIAMAAWAPAGVTVLTGLAALLYLEDG